MIIGLVLVAAGFLAILLFRHDLTVVAVIVSFIILEIGVGISQTISNDTIVASVEPAKSGAASAVSETAYELGAVVGTATLGTIFTAYYRASVELPGGLTAIQSADARESIGGAASVAQTLPPALSNRLMDSARVAFDAGIAPTATIAAVLTLIAAAVVAVAYRGVSGSADRSASAPTPAPVRPSERGSTRSMDPDTRAIPATRPLRTAALDPPRPAGRSAGR
jgi:DHA2 family multidrug resistance protein-like MFS transporter